MTSKISTIVYIFQLSSQLLKLISILLKIRKNIPKAISIQYKDPFKKTSSSNLVLYYKQGYHHIKDFDPIIVHFLYYNGCFLDIKVKLLCKNWLHCVDLASEVDEDLGWLPNKLHLVLDTQNLLELSCKFRLSLFTTYSHQWKGW